MATSASNRSTNGVNVGRACERAPKILDEREQEMVAAAGGKLGLASGSGPDKPPHKPN